jgi:hypothetical protein
MSELEELEHDAQLLAITDLINAAEDLFDVNPDITQIVIERRGGAAWLKTDTDGRWVTTSTRDLA